MRGKKRPAAERAHATGLALLDGASEASRQTGIPESTIHQWMKSPEFAELRERTKAQVADEWWAGVQHGFRRVIEAFDQEADVQKKATAAAILFDKVAMLRGEATARSETRSLTDGLSDDEKRRVREWVGRIADGSDAGSRARDGVALPSEAGPATTD